MRDPRIYPLTFTPALRDYLWGGRRLETLFGRVLPPGRVAESWEISGHPHAPTPADTGYWAGRPLPEILAALGERLTGTRSAWALQRNKFPLLVKLLDANLDLSVQVHPDDVFAQAHEHGELGKTEMWYVLHADPGAGVILGLRAGTHAAELSAALAGGSLDALLPRLAVRPGQAIALPTGTVHALLAGTVVTEIQQNSDTTYRLYDWGRVGSDGKARELHVEKALQVIDFAAAPNIVAPQLAGAAPGMARREIVRNRYFVVEEVILQPGEAYAGACDGSTLEIWGCVAGSATIESSGAEIALPAVRYVLLPAALGEFMVHAGHAVQPCTCLRAYLPENA